MGTICFWSGGKDAAMLLAELQDRGDEIAALLTTYDEGSGYVPFQSVDIGGVRLQAESAELPLIDVGLPPNPSNDVYVEGVMTALESRAPEGCDVVAFGDLHLSDIRTWRASMFEETAFTPRFPLWGRSTRKLMRRFLDLGFEALVTTVDTRELALDFLGRRFDAEFIADLPDDIDPAGENGEFHTVVYDGPIFSESLQPVVGEVVASGPFVSLQTELKARD